MYGFDNVGENSGPRLLRLAGGDHEKQNILRPN